MTSADQTVPASNPFFAPSTLECGLPPFADIRFEHYRPAFDLGCAEQLAEVDAITSNSAPPTVENTLVALEKSGRLLSRVSAVFFNKSSADTDSDVSALEEEIAPLMAAHTDAIRLNSDLYSRIGAIQASTSQRDAETSRLAERYWVEMTGAGAGLDDDQKETLRDYNLRLSVLTTRFEKNLLAETNDLALVIDDPSDLHGLDAGEVASCAAAAE